MGIIAPVTIEMHAYGWSRIASYLAKITSCEEILSFQTSTGKWLLISIRVIKTIVIHC